MRAAAKSRRSVKGLRYFSFPHRYGGSGERSEPIGALMPHAAIPFRPHHRFAVPLPRSRRGGLVTRRFLAESRNISFPRRCGGSGEHSEPIGAPMPHAAIPFRPHHRFAVPLPRSRRGGLVTRRFLAESRNISFPRRCGGSGERSEPIGAPMPHAALWVVQRIVSGKERLSSIGFQCRTRLCGWCSYKKRTSICIKSVSMPHAALWVVQRS